MSLSLETCYFETLPSLMTDWGGQGPSSCLEVVWNIDECLEKGRRNQEPGQHMRRNNYQREKCFAHSNMNTQYHSKDSYNTEEGKGQKSCQ